MDFKKLTFCLFLFLCIACKKDKEEEPEPDPCADTQLPALGTCVAVAPHGNLTYNSADSTYTYTTTGGGKVILTTDVIQIRHNDYANFKYELWGDYIDSGTVKLSYLHENMNGKHIKNKIGSNRTIVFPDGAKVTLSAQNDTSQVLTISIYDGANSYRFNSTCNKTLEHSLSVACITKKLDEAEADGEAGSFEFTSTGLMFFNLYTESSPGNKVYNRYNLAEIVLNNPNNVTDWYDDPRLGHT